MAQSAIGMGLVFLLIGLANLIVFGLTKYFKYGAYK